LWQPELKNFRSKYTGKIAVCVGDYHRAFVESLFRGEDLIAPNWKTHLNKPREWEPIKQDTEYLKNVYATLDKALKS
ncbi:MAG: hypothetical protein Q8O89_04640, partial [Nanoarchaeota archaeon]|nr:hypothetical protein [Nanoarchaeota archaeon]